MIILSEESEDIVLEAIDIREFEATFAAYVRPQSDGSVEDTRRDIAKSLLRLSVEQSFGLMQPHDVAVILSGIISVRTGSAGTRRKGQELLNASDVHIAAGHERRLFDDPCFPLRAAREADKAIVESFLAGGLSSKDGLVFIRDLVGILTWASRQEEYKLFIHQHSTEGVNHE